MQQARTLTCTGARLGCADVAAAAVIAVTCGLSSAHSICEHRLTAESGCMHAPTLITSASKALFARILSPLLHTTMSYQPRVFHSRLKADIPQGPWYTVVTYNLLAQKYIDAG